MSSEGPNDLGERIAKAQATRAERDSAKNRAMTDETGGVSAGAYALRYGVEMVACVFVGGLIGYWIDAFANTKPWGLLIVGTLGIAAGIRGIIRAYHELNAQAQKTMGEPEARQDGNTTE